MKGGAVNLPRESRPRLSLRLKKEKTKKAGWQGKKKEEEKKCPRKKIPDNFLFPELLPRTIVYEIAHE